MLRIFRMLQNSFEIQTRTSHKKAVSLITDSKQKLQTSTNPLLLVIYTAFLPFFDAYIALNDAVGMLEGTYKSKTNTFENLMDGIGDKLRQWESQVRAVFIEDSSEEIDIFPDKRGPFQTGTYEQRLGAIRVLRDKLAEYLPTHPMLAPVQGDVAAFYTLCDTARTLQQGKEGNLGELRTQREAQRITTMNAYLGIVYGGLLQVFYTNLQIIGDYIDFPLLYDLITEELIEEVTVTGGNTTVNVPLEGITVTGGKKFRIVVESADGAGVVIAYFADTNSADPGDPPRGMAVNAGDSMVVSADELGYDAGHTFLNLHNPTAAVVTVQVIEIS